MTISARLRRRVRDAAKKRCGYCLAPQHLLNGPLEIDHLVPSSRGGGDEEDNLWLACSICNTFKSDQVQAGDPQSGQVIRLFNPRADRWSDHFAWSGDGTLIAGRSPIGRATVAALQLNHEYAVNVRAVWVSVGWHPPVQTD